MKVLVACEESQRVCTAFRERGHEAYSCDIQDCSGGHPEWHIKGDVLPLLAGRCSFCDSVGGYHTISDRWDMIIAFPPCTYLCSLGTVWLSDKQPREKVEKRLKDQERAVGFFMKFVQADCEKIAIENPVGIMSKRYRKPNQYIQPYEYGHPYTKKTCLWLKGLKELSPTNIVYPTEGHWVSAGIRNRESQNRAANKSGLGESKKRRSKTFPGIAKAMAEQWGSDNRAGEQIELGDC